MDSKPIVTYAGDDKLFNSIKISLTEGLVQEPVEWERSHRNRKSVYVTANFTSFSDERLSDEKTQSLLGQAFFHIYFTECQDIDHYKQSVKDPISYWLAKLKAKKIYDWLIVVVDHTESKKGNKTKLLIRTTVLDKMKNDFPSKNSQRCISLLDPCRNDARAAESFQLLLQRIRRLILKAYDHQISQFEGHMRKERERRNEPGWNFQDFFFLQEELAFVLEMLGLYDEALVQYDELDALFTQFVINSNVGDMPEWLSNYSHACDVWCGVCLLREKTASLRAVLKKGNACLLDLRNYLFSRQCALLLLLCRPWEVAQRTLPFLHNCITELKTLEVQMAPGSVACWVFLSCFEVLQICEKFSDTSQIKEYSLYCAGLWAYARDKLHELGVLCGLMPDLKANSEKLHIVVSLLAGMGVDPYLETGVTSPHSKLREALSSKESFLKHYTELCELTLGTFKHNRRIRMARLIGKDLAHFYMKMGEHQKAVSFLLDLLKTYQEEKWDMLSSSIQQDLLQCYQATDDTPRYLKTCIRLAAHTHLDLDERKDYFQEIIRCSEKLGADPLLLRTEKTLEVSGVEQPMPAVVHSETPISFRIRSHFPSDIICRNVRLVLKKDSDKGKHFDRSEEKIRPQFGISSYSQEGLPVFSVSCKNTHQVLRRRDSRGFHKEDSPDDGGPTFKSSMVKLTPGDNRVSIALKIGESGTYSFHRLWLEWGNIHFALSALSFSFTVKEEQPALVIKPQQGDLIAGIEQNLLLNISSGSTKFTDDSHLIVKTSRGLKLSENGSEWGEELRVSLPNLSPFESCSIPVCAMAHFGAHKSASAVEHWLSVQYPWVSNMQRIVLHFLPPFLVSQKLHTCATRKYIQIVIHGTSSRQFEFGQVRLESPDKMDVPLKPLFSPLNMAVDLDQTASFLWEILYEEWEQLPLHFHFSAEYQAKNEATTMPYNYHHEFRLNNYETLYGVRTRIEPPKGSEFCRANIPCSLHVSVTQMHRSEHTALMYELVADQAMWTVCGRTAGVVNIEESGKHSVILEVMPLLAGFLPLPTIRLSKYIPAEQRKPASRDSTPSKESGHYNAARLEPFEPGQIYSWSRAMQVHVLPASNAPSLDPVN